MKTDVYQEVTDRIIELMESADPSEWMAPFAKSAAAGLPVNGTTKKKYRGVNVLALWLEAQDMGFESNRWASYKQWQSVGRQVGKGERGSRVIFFRVIDKDADNDEDEPEKVRIIRFSSVFNEHQLEDWEPSERNDPPDWETGGRIRAVREFMAATGATIKDRGRAYYDPVADHVAMPRPSAFDGPEDYYSVAFHELTHWTGHKTRLDRNSAKRFGDSAYAMEELIAELGSAFVCASLGIEPKPKPDQHRKGDKRAAEYLAHWLDVMRADKKAIVTAASKASDAADYLHAFSDDREAVAA